MKRPTSLEQADAILFDLSAKRKLANEKQPDPEDFCPGEPVPKEDYTCFNCGSEPTCPYKWDSYNTYGDCLAEK